MTLISLETSPALSKFLPWISKLSRSNSAAMRSGHAFEPLVVKNAADIEHDHRGHEDGDPLLPGEFDDLLVGALAPAIDDGADCRRYPPCGSTGCWSGR